MEHQLGPYDQWPPAVTAAEYNDALAVPAYLKHFHRWFMSDLEKRCLDVGHDHRKMQATKRQYQGTPYFSQTMNEAIQNDELKWNAASNADVREALGCPANLDDLTHALRRFYDNVNTRIKNAILSGEITVNRCPRCSRVVRTPSAKQCMWCKHDWH